MTIDDRAKRQQSSLALALKGADLTVEELWLRYFGLGGDEGLIDVDAYVHGLGGLPSAQRDILAHAVNERLDELAWSHRASYTREIRESLPRSQPLTALVRLLEGAELAPPDRLPAVAEAAGRALDVQVTVYLADYTQRFLHPLRVGADSGTGTALEVDATLAGRAFRETRTFAAQAPDRPRLWVPLLDGAERLGVLDVGVADPEDVHDRGLRTQCQWLAMLLGHLITLLNQHGDALDRVRLRAPRTVDSELIQSMLPPLTSGVDGFLVTGALEPHSDISGDAFDYALSETTATLIVLDATGHDVRGGLIAAAALAAHRIARRAGLDLRGQARAIDEVISTQFGDGASATAVLVELDLATGRLRYLNAGHPDPLILRRDDTVTPLTSGRRPPLGLAPDSSPAAEESLRADDWLVLHTDGVTGARDSDGEPFGEARLVDFLRRESTAGHPPPEAARRLVQAVLAHQDGDPEDDATVLLARWTDLHRPV